MKNARRNRDRRSFVQIGGSMTALKLDQIRMDGGTQSRASIDAAVVDDYAQAVRDGTDLPAVIVFHDGKKYWLADGFHRVEAYRAAGAIEINADVRQGDKRQAILFSVGANATHGLRRSNDDKRRAVQTLLSDEEWSAWSNREIARRAGVSEKFVRSLRPERSEESDDHIRAYTTKHGTASSMDTSKIGKAEGDNSSPGASQQSEFDRQRYEAREALPPEVKEAQALRDEAIAARKDRSDDAVAALEAELDELREANGYLESELAEAKAENAKWQDMRVQFEQGGFEKVVTDLREEIRVLQTRVETESTEKVRNLRSADYWQKEARKLGYGDDDIIPLTPKGGGHG